MKKLLLSLVLISIVTISFSQSSSKYTKYGVRAGMNISNLDFDPAPPLDNGHRNGFFFGGFAEYPLSDSMSLNAEIQWSAQGAKDEDLRADYLNLPVQLKFALGERMMIGVGPQVSLKTWENNDNFTTWTFSGVGGLEYMFTDDLFFDVRALYGFSDILDSQANLEAKDFTIQFGVGIKI